MNVLGYELVRVDSFPEDLPPPDGLTDAISVAGLIHEPVVRKADGRILVGRRRIAAHREIGKREVQCKMVDCTDDEAELWELQENAYRHDMTADERSAAIRRTFDVVRRIMAAGEVEPAPPPAPTKRKRGRPPKANKEAVQKVAETLNLTPATVKAAIGEQPSRAPAARKERAKAAKAEEPPAAPDAVAPDLETFGLDLGGDWLAAVGKYAAGLEAAEGFLGAASAALGRLDAALGDGTAMGDARGVARAREDLKALAKRLDGLRPVSLCWYCKGADGHSEKCTACAGGGVGTKAQIPGVPAELTDKAHLRIAVGGKFVDMPGAEVEAPADDDDVWPV